MSNTPDRSPHAPSLRDALVEISESRSTRALTAALMRGIVTANEMDAPSVASRFSSWIHEDRTDDSGIRLRALAMIREWDAAGKECQS